MASIDQLVHVSNAAWCVKHSSSSEDLVLNVEQHQANANQALLEAVPRAVEAGLLPRLAGLPGLATDVVQGLTTSEDFRQSVLGAVHAVVESSQFKETLQGVVQAAVESPQFLEKITGAIKSIVFSTEFMDALAPKVAAVQQPALGQLVQQHMAMLHPRQYAPPPYSPGAGGHLEPGGGTVNVTVPGAGAAVWGGILSGTSSLAFRFNKQFILKGVI